MKDLFLKVVLFNICANRSFKLNFKIFGAFAYHQASSYRERGALAAFLVALAAFLVALAAFPLVAFLVALASLV